MTNGNRDASPSDGPGPRSVSQLTTAVLYYLAGAERVHAVLLGQDGSSQAFALMPWAEAFPLIDDLLDALDTPYPESYKAGRLERFAESWGRQLLPPPGALSAFDVLVIVPHHLLHRVPLHVVRLTDGGMPLGTTQGLTYCSSATLLRYAMSRNPARHHDLQAWRLPSGTHWPAAAPTPPSTCVSVATDVVHGQTAAYRELSDVFAEFFPDFLSNDGLLPRQVLKRAGPQVLCVVCHGHFDEAMPWNSGLLLGTRRGISTERPILLGSGHPANFRDLPFRYLPMDVEVDFDVQAEFLAIDELKVDAACQADLVALLACTTAASTPTGNDEPGSLAEQWLRLGGASVLAPLWEADIDLCRDWCRLFLTEWIRRRQPKALAWAHTNRTLAATSSTISPYRWGTVTLWGDWL